MAFEAQDALLQRIMGVKYSFPTNLHISRECLDMMSKIFVGNPANRISIAGIKSHPWFTKNLPDELKVRCVLEHSASSSTHSAASLNYVTRGLVCGVYQPNRCLLALDALYPQDLPPTKQLLIPICIL